MVLLLLHKTILIINNKNPLYFPDTTDFYYIQKTFNSRTSITPGTENNAEIKSVNQFIPIEMGTK